MMTTRGSRWRMMQMNQAQIIQATVPGGQRAPAESKDLTFSEYSWWGTRQMYSKPFSETPNPLVEQQKAACDPEQK